MRNIFTPFALIRLAALLALVGCGFLAAVATQLVENDQVRSVNASIQMTTDLDSEQARAFLTDIDQLSERTDTTTVVDRTQFGERTLFVASGGHGDRWLREGYRSFTPDLKFQVQPLSELPMLDIRQTYDSSGGEKYNEELRAIADNYGVQSQKLVNRELQYFLDTPVAVGLPLVIVASSALVFFSAIFNRRRHAILSLHGASGSQIFAQDFRVGILKWSPAFLGLSILSVVILVSYTSRDGTLYYARYFVLFAAPTFMLLLLVWFISVYFSSRSQLVETLDGRMRAAPVMAAGYVIRLVASVILVSATVSVFNHYPELLRQNSMIPDLGQVASLYRVTINAARTPDALQAQARAFTEVVNNDIETGSAVEFRRSVDENGTTVVAMNRSAAERFLSPNAQDRVDTVPRSSGLLLYPSDDRVSPAQAQSTVNSLGKTLYLDKDLCGEHGCSTLAMEQDYVAYSPLVEPGWWQADVKIEQPAVLVYPDNFRPAIDIDTLAYLSSGNILFINSDAVRQFQQRNGFENAILSQGSVGSYWMERNTELETIVRVDMSALILSILSVMGFGAAFSLVAYLVWYQRFRVGYIFGLNTLRRFRAVIAGELMVACFTTGYLAKLFYDSRPISGMEVEFAQSTLETVSKSMVAASLGVTVTTTLLILGVLSIASTRVQKSRAV